MVANKVERIEARLTQEQKALISRAAELDGLSTSAFVVQRALESAAKVVEQRELIRLSARDSRLVVEQLINPPEPNAALRRAAERHRQLDGQ